MRVLGMMVHHAPPEIPSGSRSKCSQLFVIWSTNRRSYLCDEDLDVEQRPADLGEGSNRGNTTSKWKNEMIVRIKSILHRLSLPVLRGILPLLEWMVEKAYQIQAQRLNAALFQKVRGIDRDRLGQVRGQLRGYAEQRGLDVQRREKWVSHAQRLILTQEWLEDAIQDLPGNLTALDLGPPSVASDYWRAAFPNIRWQNTDWDLRYSWDVPSSTCDLILCTELVEHLSDPPNDIYNEGFYKVGFQSMLKESYRALKPGGYLLGTTPNAGSVLHLQAALEGKPPWYYEKHVREYTLNEIRYQLSQAGFEMVRSEDVHCLSVNEDKEYTTLFLLLLRHDYPVTCRGDDLFFLAKKP